MQTLAQATMSDGDPAAPTLRRLFMTELSSLAGPGHHGRQLREMRATHPP